jgi:hypothetical protein
MDNCRTNPYYQNLQTNMFAGVDRLPLAMSYIPMQQFNTTFDLSKGLECGTIFPELVKPFLGRRGACR